MEVSPQHPPLVALDLSKSYSVAAQTRSHTEAMDLAKKPEWYHRRPVSCGTDINSAFRPRASTSYGSLSTRLLPEPAPVHCRDMDQRSGTLGTCTNSTLARGLDLYRDRVHGNLWPPGFYRPERTGSPVVESSGGEESDSDSDVVFLVSSVKEPLLCSPFIPDSVGHIAEPLSPAVSSLDEGRGCYHLPQPLSSPSPDSSYSEDSSDTSVDIPTRHARPVVLLSDLSAIYDNHTESPVDISSDDSDVIEVSVTHGKKRCIFLKKSLEGETQSDDGKVPPTEIRRSSRIRKSISETSPSACRAPRHSLKRRAKNDAVGIYYESCDSDGVIEHAARLSSSDAEPASPPESSQEASRNEYEMERKSPPRVAHPRHKHTELLNCKQKKPSIFRRSEGTQRSDRKETNRSLEEHQKTKMANTKTAKRWRKKRRPQRGASAQFPPREPEIKLKYAKVKEEKKERKSGSFSPFVHVEKRSCIIVNYQEEEAMVRSSLRGQQHTRARSVSGFVPNTSCFHLGRFPSENWSQAALVCSLCGQTANAMGLGDLHGPYLPASPSANCQNQNCRTEDDGSCNGSAAGLQEINVDSLPKVPLQLHECWIHEDCGIWSTGVFLVRGKLYGLEEAARLAQETVRQRFCLLSTAGLKLA